MYFNDGYLHLASAVHNPQSNCAQAAWSALKCLQGCLGKMSKNGPKLVYKPVGGRSLPFSYTKPQVFIVYHYDLLATSILTTNYIIS
ncbi:unnamed protein product [Staurois parvus]|uniref:Uncharacterized protein n=1 Tax=Staurois parvus TaxID=386267 RepID=A0ABN9BG05_9NEOB|nr:unnamed protein product [Staurois parvus]